MKRTTAVIAISAALFVGLALGSAIAKNKADASVFKGKPAKVAGRALLDLAASNAGSGSWENIDVARVYYRAGFKKEAEAILDKVRAGRLKDNDWIRIGRLYQQVGDWAKAKAAFDKVIQMSPDDQDWMAEIGAYYNLHGDRAEAEKLFTRSFKRDSESFRNMLKAGGSYFGVPPEN